MLFEPQFQATINTHGNIKAVGCAFYTDSTGVCLTSQIDWGTLEPGQTANVTLYMKSLSNVPVSVSMAVGNFNPANGASYLACTWNYGKRNSKSRAVSRCNLHFNCRNHNYGNYLV